MPMSKHYIRQPVQRAELMDLRMLALAEEQDFYRRNPHTSEPYRHRLLAIALCQGAALQYLGRGYGVNDFDVHFFYKQNPDKLRLSRGVKRIIANVGNFRSVPVDFLRTVIPGRVATAGFADGVNLLRTFLQSAATPTAKHLAQKAVVGLSPQPLWEFVIWPTEDTLRSPQ
jgi:hypothetical protein